MTHKIELKKIKYSKSLSEETNAYTAQIWVDGKHFCDVSNHGYGGGDEHHPINGKHGTFVEELQRLNAEIKATYPAKDTGMMLKGKPFIMEQDLESVCNDLLAEHLITKDLQRLLKRTVAFFDPTTKQVRSYTGKHEGEARTHLITETLRKNPNATILNNLPLIEAIALFKKAS